MRESLSHCLEQSGHVCKMCFSFQVHSFRETSCIPVHCLPGHASVEDVYEAPVVRRAGGGTRARTGGGGGGGGAPVAGLGVVQGQVELALLKL